MQNGQKNKKIFAIVIITVVILLVLGLLFYFIINNKKDNILEFTEKELSGEYDEFDGTITLKDSNISIDGKNISKKDNSITINKKGVYQLNGNGKNINIIIDAGEKAEVQLVLNNCNINNETNIPINCKSAKKLMITLAKDSENTITENISEDNEIDVKSAIFCNAELLINGNGKLNVIANSLEGISSENMVRIVNTNIDVTSADDGIKGKNYVVIKDSTININTENDGIKANNDKDAGMGCIYIDGGKLNLETKYDAIQAESLLKIYNNAQIDVVTTGEGLENVKDEESCKGLKVEKELIIDSGIFNLASRDDNIHGKEKVTINNGTFILSTEDDAIHSDGPVTINNGEITIETCMEGIEGNYITINNGNIDIVAIDDGINVAGDSDPDAPRGSTSEQLHINGGNIKLIASGDGIDANGSIYINGGSVFVEGPTSGVENTLDYSYDCIVKGGELVVLGADVTWKNPTPNSPQLNIIFSNTIKADSEVVVMDSNGNIIKRCVTRRDYDKFSISSEKLKESESYILYVNGEEVCRESCKARMAR